MICQKGQYIFGLSQCNIVSWWCDFFFGRKMQIHPGSNLNLNKRVEQKSRVVGTIAPRAIAKTFPPLMSFSSEKTKQKEKRKRKRKIYIPLTFLSSRIWKLLSLSIKSNKLFYYILYILDSTQIWKEKKKKNPFCVCFFPLFYNFL